MFPTSTRSDIITPDGVVCMLLLMMRGRFKIPVDLTHEVVSSTVCNTRDIMYGYLPLDKRRSLAGGLVYQDDG